MFTDIRCTSYFPNAYPVHYLRTTLMHYRVTYAYTVIGMTYKDNAGRLTGDPAFRIRVACAYCNTQTDEYTKHEGREYCEQALVDGESFEADVYLGQEVISAVEREIGKMSTAAMKKIHVPSKLCAYYHEIAPKRAVVDPKAETARALRRSERAQKSRQSRSVYYSFVHASGLTPKEAAEQTRKFMTASKKGV